MGSRWGHGIVGVLGIVVFGTVTACADDRDETTARAWEPDVVRTEQCPDSRFECVTLTVPRDHFGTDPTAWEVTYAIQPAAVERRGTFVTITGGPGSSGIASADSYTDVMGSQITDYNDIVFLNQRGSGPYQPLRCDEAAATYYSAPVSIDTPEDRDGLAATLETFVDDCIAESGADTDDLPYYATRQAVEDLELIRQQLGVDQLTLYGESYGSQFVQTYAAAHPNRVAALIVDGVVDLTVDGLTWYHETARAYHDALTASFAACELDEACAAEAGDASALGDAYDALVAQLEQEPIEYQFPLADGSSETRTLTAVDVETAAAGNVGGFSGRMQLLRALNAANTGNYVPLDRMADQYLSIDPETQEVIPIPDWSDALYFAVECQDYTFVPDTGTPRQQLDAWIDLHIENGDDQLRLGDVALGDLPCLYWPERPSEVERPAPIVDPPYTTLVLTSDTDPATPTVNAMRVFSRLDDAYLITLEGGPHVIFDWGYSCVDELVADFVGLGTEPPTRVTICDGDVIDPYVASAPATPTDIADQLLSHVEYTNWAGEEPLAFGCDFGGTARFEVVDDSTEVTLDDCEFTDEYPIDATGVIDADGLLTIEIAG